MPNWIEGTLKLRGKRENIRRFFNEGLDGKGKITDRSTESCLDFSFGNCHYIKDTNRAFIVDGNAYLPDDDFGTVCVSVQQAWGFVLEEWKAISDRYEIDVRLFGIEGGMAFTEEIIIEQGKEPIDIVNTYDDWIWECPFPYMGG